MDGRYRRQAWSGRFAVAFPVSCASMDLRFSIRDLDELTVFAGGLAMLLRAGDTLAFSGPVGAGKTTLIAAIAAALDGDDVASPTFTLWHRYRTTPPINHLDCYRIASPDELPELGLEEAFDEASITLVEWPEHAPSLLPSTTRYLSIEGVDTGPREIRLQW